MTHKQMADHSRKAAELATKAGDHDAAMKWSQLVGHHSHAAAAEGDPSAIEQMVMRACGLNDPKLFAAMKANGGLANKSVK